MGRRSRSKRKGAQPPRAQVAPTSPTSYAGARVARVSVDDETWAAFRAMCGHTPASVRLGDLVVAEVERNTREGSTTPDALAALRAIQDQAAVLESYVRASKPVDV